ncbi:MAG TPA: hypothetical protein ENO24_01300 [Chloroflexi bacterium]|nr:hypothetical protein [Chloroflexota bacterium]
MLVEVGQGVRVAVGVGSMVGVDVGVGTGVSVTRISVGVGDGARVGLGTGDGVESVDGGEAGNCPGWDIKTGTGKTPVSRRAARTPATKLSTGRMIHALPTEVPSMYVYLPILRSVGSLCPWHANCNSLCNSHRGQPDRSTARLR